MALQEIAAEKKQSAKQLAMERQTVAFAIARSNSICHIVQSLFHSDQIVELVGKYY